MSLFTVTANVPHRWYSYASPGRENPPQHRSPQKASMLPSWVAWT